jgi:hypothetical protein
MKFDLASLVKFAPLVISLVQGAKDKWGAAKTGPEKFQAVEDVILGTPTMTGAIAVTEQFTGKDHINEQNVKTVVTGGKALVQEGIQLAYEIMKKKERLEEIGRMLDDLRGTGLPVQ